MSYHEIDIPRVSLKVYEHGIAPAIQVNIRYKLSLDRIPVNIKGSVYSEDKKFISVLTQLPPVDMWKQNYDSGEEERDRSSILLRPRDEPNGTKEYEHDMIFTLDKKALDYLEDRRYLTKNRDVIFRFHLTLTTLGSTIRAGQFKSDSSSLGEGKNKREVILASDNPAGSDLDFNILVSSHSSKSQDQLFLSEVSDKKISITIPSSDWVNDFQEKLGLGKFMIVEIPRLTIDLNGINDTSLDDDQRELRARLLAALENLGIIEDKIKKAEWKEAAEACRATIEPLYKGNIRTTIKEMIKQQSGIEEKMLSI